MTDDALDYIRTLARERSDERIILDIDHYVYFGRGQSEHWQAKYDLSKLIELDDYELRYVAHIIRQALVYGSGTMRTSNKYSFRDCESWYSGCLVRDPQPGANIIHMEIES